MTHVEVVLNQKGGVGKSTIAVNLAATTAEVLTTPTQAAEDDVKSEVATVSIDPQGSATWWASRVENLPFHLIQAHDDLHGLTQMGNLPGIRHVFVDTPGWLGQEDGDAASADPVERVIGNGPSAAALRTVLSVADHVLIPVEPEPLGFDPTARTIERLIKPLGLDFLVVVNNWDPRDGKADLLDTLEFIKGSGWPVANTVIRHYKLHTRAAADGRVVTEYPKNRTSMEARADFMKLALELKVGGR